MRRVLETAVILMGTIGWWGFVYPELCLTWETCEASGEEAEYDGITDQFAGPGGKFCIKSEVVEYLYQEKEKGFQNDGHKRTHRGI